MLTPHRHVKEAMTRYASQHAHRESACPYMLRAENRVDATRACRRAIRRYFQMIILSAAARWRAIGFV